METVGATPDPTDKATCDHLQHSTADLALFYSVRTLFTILCIVRKSLAWTLDSITYQQQHSSRDVRAKVILLLLLLDQDNTAGSERRLG